MNIPNVWTRETWQRSATPTIPSVIEVAGHLVSEATEHHADLMGQDRWVVDYLPGRHLTREQAKAAMKIAVAPDKPEVERWSAALGLTAAEALGYMAMGA
ncbi:hypothetical protein [Nocardia fluminea]|uniref:hypothetical protein n=1 Tax=Nocardia fluminea TaxID=134984 RepID=UPI00365D2E9D